ncbi:flavin-containing monooxygenase [Streptomyces sp. NPDC012950]|uniref:flavin-containing monooxygenase n=1 Tax=Streptomyces sp. NPDC012950 TaxID=3364858 RepID=UPI0036ABC6B7
MEHIDVAVIGGGQSGLATAHALLRRGLQPVVLEASGQAAGSWPRYYDSLTLFSPARYSSLPGMPFPGADRDRYPHRDEVVAYLTAYADRLDADIRTGQCVTSVRRNGSAFEVVLEGGGRLTARAVVAASGTFGRPHRPALPGLEGFTGHVLHAADYRSPAPFTGGGRPVVVGAGNSAVQIAAELAATARVTLATRGPVKFAAQRILGRDLHFWTARTGLDIAPLWPAPAASAGAAGPRRRPLPRRPGRRTTRPATAVHRRRRDQAHLAGRRVGGGRRARARHRLPPRPALPHRPRRRPGRRREPSAPRGPRHQRAGAGVRRAGVAAQPLVELAARGGTGRGADRPAPGRPPRAGDEPPMLVRRVST